MIATVSDVGILLLSCPFCDSHDLHIESDSEPKANYSVECDNPECEASGPVGDCPTPKAAAKKWNIRA